MTQDELKKAVGRAAVNELLPHLERNSIIGAAGLLPPFRRCHHQTTSY